MAMAEEHTAAQFIARLEAHQSDTEREKLQRHFKTGPGEYGAGDQFLGVRMGEVFALAKEFLAMEPGQIEALLDSPVHEVRAGGVSILDKQARRKRTSEDRRKALYDLYLRRIDAINNWDLVDLGAPHVVGGYLFDKPREPLYALARSEDLWARRTAMMATLYFVRQGDLDDMFALAEILRDDEHDLIHKPVGGLLREAGKHDRDRLLAFLDTHAAVMPRTMLRYAMEHLAPEVREHYRSLA